MGSKMAEVEDFSECKSPEHNSSMRDFEPWNLNLRNETC